MDPNIFLLVRISLITGLNKPHFIHLSECHQFSKIFVRESLRAYIGASVSRALDSRIIGRNYLTSRINWVVQSTAVDFLHLLLVAVHWLFHTMHIKAGLFCTYVLPVRKVERKFRNFHVWMAESSLLGGWRLRLVPRSPDSPSLYKKGFLYCLFLKEILWLLTIQVCMYKIVVKAALISMLQLSFLFKKRS